MLHKNVGGSATQEGEPQTSSISISWESVRNALSRPLPDLLNQNPLGAKGTSCVQTALQMILMQLARWQRMRGKGECKRDEAGEVAVG